MGSTRHSRCVQHDDSPRYQRLGSLGTKPDSELHAELEHAQTWESDSDPHGQQLPRAKRHDDKSLAAIRFSD
ncbi:hypothetical protein SAMN05216266_113127 [Amycolatopsis marina]|uniref:Uncharacterized protein n=1 Tax=Amycolatopsis marina TaxID=490629 RepID=A0A1I1BHS5_9PSEU|nr:hypothetical protein SAMN05216266_113127 [Amycolatopsis marina]